MQCTSAVTTLNKRDLTATLLLASDLTRIYLNKERPEHCAVV